MSEPSVLAAQRRKSTKERIYQYKVDETKLNVDKFANVSKMVNTRVSDMDKRLDEFKMSIQISLNEMSQRLSALSALSERINTCDSKCEELLDTLNAIMDVIEDHKNKIELLGK